MSWLCDGGWEQKAGERDREKGCSVVFLYWFTHLLSTPSPLCTQFLSSSFKRSFVFSSFNYLIYLLPHFFFMGLVTYPLSIHPSFIQLVSLFTRPLRISHSNRLFFFFFFFFFFWAAPTAYGRSQARGPIEAVATGPRQSHSNTGSEPHLWTTPQLTATLDP